MKAIYAGHNGSVKAHLAMEIDTDAVELTFLGSLHGYEVSALLSCMLEVALSSCKVEHPFLLYH